MPPYFTLPSFTLRALILSQARFHHRLSRPRQRLPINQNEPFHTRCARTYPLLECPYAANRNRAEARRDRGWRRLKGNVSVCGFSVGCDREPG